MAFTSDRSPAMCVCVGGGGATRSLFADATRNEYFMGIEVHGCGGCGGIVVVVV